MCMGKWKTIRRICCCVLVCVVVGHVYASPGGTAADSTLTDYVLRHCLSSDNVQPGRESVILFVEFLRFGCLTCLDQFLDFCDTVRKTSGTAGPVNVVVVIKRDRQEERTQFRAMRSWLDACGLNLPFILAPEGVFSEFGVGSTALMILDRRKDFAWFGPIPATPAERKSVIERIIMLKKSVK